MRFRNYLLSTALFFSVLSCKKEGSDEVDDGADNGDNSNGGELIFNTGFENSTYMVASSGQLTDIKGFDGSVGKPNDWLADLINHPNIGTFRLYYEQGDSSQRLARLVADPVNASNQVLNFKILTPHINIPLASQYTVNGIVFDKKARIQADLYGNNDLKEIYQSVRLFIPNDFNKLIGSKYPGSGDWITLFEFWNDEWWTGNSPYPFRFGINMVKGEAVEGSPLYLKAEGQKQVNGKITRVWENKNVDYPVPIGKWMTIDYYIKEGNKGMGRFYLSIKPDGGATTVLFDLNNETAHPDDPNPSGLGEFNPIKLYTSNNMINQMSALGGTFQVYWDDFKLWKNKRP